MKKILGILGVVAIVATVFLTNNLNNNNSNQEIASILSFEMTAANAMDTVDGCDTDPQDECYSAETGSLLSNDCDPSSWWDTCDDGKNSSPTLQEWYDLIKEVVK